MVCAGNISVPIGAGTAAAQQWNFSLTATNAHWSTASSRATLTEEASLSPTPPASTTSVPPTPTPSGPPVNDDTSGSWSGYAVDGSGLTNVSGTFTVPALYANVQCNETVSDWVGVDGWQSGDNNLLKAGITESMTDPNTGTCGAHVYYVRAWWETQPGDVQFSSIPIWNGNRVTVNIWKGAPGFWDISLTDDTNGQSFSVQQQYAGRASSAEWITEADTVDGTQSPIAPFTPLKWSALQIPITASVSEVDQTTLQQGGNTEAVPSDVASLQSLLRGGFTTSFGDGS